jgi:hypothetical protein
MEKADSSIIIINSGKGADQQQQSNGSNAGSSPNLSFTAGANWIVNVKTEVIMKNMFIRPDGFSSITFENIGEDPCSIMDSCPVNPENKAREWINRPGEILTTQINVIFENKSAVKRLLITKVYYLKA